MPGIQFFSVLFLVDGLLSVFQYGALLLVDIDSIVCQKINLLELIYSLEQLLTKRFHPNSILK